MTQLRDQSDQIRLGTLQVLGSGLHVGGLAPDDFLNQKSFLFDGVNEIIEGPGSSVVIGTSPTAITFSAWVKTTNTANRYIQSLKRDLTSASSLFSIRVDGADKFGLILRLAASTKSTAYVVPGGLTDGGWHHVLGTWDNVTGAEAIVDGVSVGTEADLLGTDADLEEPYTVGGFDQVNPTLSWNGNIDEPAVYGGLTKFTLAQAQELYDQTGPGKPGNPSLISRGADLKTWYRMGDAVGDDATGTTGKLVDQVNSPALDGTPFNTESGDFVLDVP